MTVEGTGNPALSLGEIIRRQRELTELSMRQFAAMVGISNPYLSQIERGLREPSEQVLEAIAESLETSADALYEQAGVSHDVGRPAEHDAWSTPSSADPALTGRAARARWSTTYERGVLGRRTREPRRRRRPASARSTCWPAAAASGRAAPRGP